MVTGGRHGSIKELVVSRSRHALSFFSVAVLWALIRSMPSRPPSPSMRCWPCETDSSWVISRCATPAMPRTTHITKSENIKIAFPRGSEGRAVHLSRLKRYVCTRSPSSLDKSFGVFLFRFFAYAALPFFVCIVCDRRSGQFHPEVAASRAFVPHEGARCPAQGCCRRGLRTLPKVQHRSSQDPRNGGGQSTPGREIVDTGCFRLPFKSQTRMTI